MLHLPCPRQKRTFRGRLSEYHRCPHLWSGTIREGLIRVAEQVPVVGNILTLIERRDWARLERFLAPEVHWTTGIEEQLRGPKEVIATLQDDPVPGPPAFHEVDGDGRLTRWIDKVG